MEDSRRKAQESTAELMAIFENAAIILVLVDQQRRVVNLNKAGLTIAKKTYQETLGMPAGQLLNCVNAITGNKVTCGQTPECAGCCIRRTIDDSFETAYDHDKEDGHMILRNDEGVVPMDFQVSTTLLEIHGREYVLLSMDDITRLVEQEQQLETLLADKDRLISILSHDLRGPFGTVVGLTDVLKENLYTLEPPRLKEVVDQISDTAHNAYLLLDDLLFWIKSQSGHVLFEPKEVMLSDIFSKVYATQKLIAASKNIKISYSEDKPLSTYADVNMLRAILRNLLSNAIKFTPKGGFIKVSATITDNNVLVTVSDTGVGIEVGRLCHIFDTQHFETTTGTAGERGTGFGLLLCREFVEIHGGRIWVESTLDEGSQFRFMLPSRRE